MNRINRTLAVIFALAAGSTATLRADVVNCSTFGSYDNTNPAVTSCIYSNFRNDDLNDNGFISYAGDGITGISPSFSFSPGMNLSLTEVDFVTSVHGTDGDTYGVTITLSQDTPGNLINVLASQDFTGQTGVEGSTNNPPSIQTWNPTGIELTAGATYWLTLSSTDANVVWNDNSVHQAGYDVLSDPSTWVSTNATLGAIAILTSPTPEPATWLLFASGLLVALVFTRRQAQNKAARIFSK